MAFTGNVVVCGQARRVIGDLLDLVELLQSVDSSTVVGVCKVLPRRHRSTGLPHEEFNIKAATFNRMLDALFDDRPSVFVWGHLEFSPLPVESFCLMACI